MTELEYFPTLPYPKLYKRTSTGATQVWWQELHGNEYRTCSGKENGAIVVSEWTVCEGKNLGKANATSGSEQAIKEVLANYVLKRKGGYQDTPDAAHGNTDFKPMLAKEYEDHKKDVIKAFVHGVRVQPKLDGMRCIATKDGLVSRGGNPIVTVPHVVHTLASLFKQWPDAILDGELYNHDLKADFPTLMSLVKKQKPTDKDFEKTAEMIQYHVYDVATRDHFNDVMAYIDTLETLDFRDTPVRLVPSHFCDSEAALEYMHAANLERGYEGTMIRLMGPYEQKRSKLLLKYKPEMDSEFKLLELHEGQGNRSGMAGYAVLALPQGGTFRANIMGDRDRLRRLLENRDELVGKEATVLYFHLTPDGVPRFPRIKVIHDTPRW